MAELTLSGVNWVRFLGGTLLTIMSGVINFLPKKARIEGYVKAKVFGVCGDRRTMTARKDGQLRA